MICITKHGFNVEKLWKVNFDDGVVHDHRNQRVQTQGTCSQPLKMWALNQVPKERTAKDCFGSCRGCWKKSMVYLVAQPVCLVFSFAWDWLWHLNAFEVSTWHPKVLFFSSSFGTSIRFSKSCDMTTWDDLRLACMDGLFPLLTLSLGSRPL